MREGDLASGARPCRPRSCTVSYIMLLVFNAARIFQEHCLGVWGGIVAVLSGRLFAGFLGQSKECLGTDRQPQDWG